MASAQLMTGRARKLADLFQKYIEGQRIINGAQEAKHFLEAFDVICQHKSPALCVESIVSSPKGTETVSIVVRSDLSHDFVSSVMVLLLKHLSDPLVRTINNGNFLQPILRAILSPPTFWSALLRYYEAAGFNCAHAEIFAWLCFEIVSMKSTDLETHYADVVALMDRKALVQSLSHSVRQLAYRIEKVINLHSIADTASGTYSPGGRHDNDFAEFRSISIYPTADEVRSVEEPFLQRLSDVFDCPRESRAAVYISWLFRLLREDMLADLREDLCIAWGKKKGRRRPLSLGKLTLVGFGDGDKAWVDPLALQLVCEDGIVFPKGTVGDNAKKKFLKESKSFMKHKSLGVLCHNDHIIAFGSLFRNADLLLTEPPTVVIKFTSTAAMRNAMEAFLDVAKDEIRFFVVDTATFAYEPILQRLKEITEIPLDAVLLEPSSAPNSYQPPQKLSRLLDQLRGALKENQLVSLPSLLQAGKTIHLSGAQLESLINGLENSVGQIQGPPGTGKSFIGTLISKILLKYTDYRILVLSYTNHALDQFLEDLLDIGVPENDMVRLGSKSTQRTDPLRLGDRTREPEFRFSVEVSKMLRALKEQASDVSERFTDLGAKLAAAKVDPEDVLAMLEFSDDGKSFWEAFQVPDQRDGFSIIGKNNKPMQPGEVLDAWVRGGDMMPYMDPAYAPVWSIPVSSRLELLNQWSSKIRQDQMQEFTDLAKLLADIQRLIDSLYNETKRKVLRSKRVIGCTTTAAAMYQSIIKSAEPDVVLVEEAGEILEAHVLTALSPSVKQLVLIGDHKQLRPKVNSYKLTVEKGEGFNLNMSLFERLIHQGHHYTALREQHRSHPDISHFTRHLAYPNLQDSPKTLQRARVRGLKGRAIFVHHEHPEEKLDHVADRQEVQSKRNAFEARMVIKMVRYLGQQGYKSENMVVLTPYLGQLSLLQQQLSLEHDPCLNDLDSHELIRAGLMTQAAAKVNKRSIRLSTIGTSRGIPAVEISFDCGQDNYQGEESDVVIASLTRSNASGDIGFMSSRERLVVLMSRAREGIVLFGNMHTFMNSKKGGELWNGFLQELKDKECLFDGVPVHCQQHPDRSALLKSPEDFDQHCPDGGCAEPCGEVLSCEEHTCERRCHRAIDHYQVICQKKLLQTCSRGHKIKVSCSNKSQGCKSCASEDEETRRRALRDFELEKSRQEQQDVYARELQRIEDEIDHHERVMSYQDEAATQKAQLAEKKAKLKRLKEVQQRREEAVKNGNRKERSENGPANEDSQQLAGAKPKSIAQQEWEDLKANGEPSNDALDKLMDLIGLESVKDEFLSVKSNVDAKIRQSVPLSEERLSCSLLGNPGTGKTTVARLWGEFLVWTGALSGNGFTETSGSKLANLGVSGCEKLLEELKDKGGGAFFIDEAYQLSSGNSPGGRAVLDYLLAEVENLRGKVVFVIAGYSKQMEAFFAHNPGFPSRFPVTMTFDDYSDEELLQILQRQVNRRFKGRMNIEGGTGGLYFRIAARRIGRGRGKDGFGNARAVENALARMEKRQATRLRKERRSGAKLDDYSLTKEDIIGPEPSSTLSNCVAWRRLNEMIGLSEVKQEVKMLLDSLRTNYQRELEEEPLVSFCLNRVFIGSPGTGKTTVAKLYGQILVALGMLSNGEVVVKTPADFVGSVLGESEAKTKGILASTLGKVLVIDEAYGLQSGGGAKGSSVADPYRTAVVDTIVAEVQNVPGEDRSVILLGYKEQMEEMFRNVNPGFSRRFAVDSPFVFQDFDNAALLQILELKLKGSGFNATGQAKRVAVEVLARERNRPGFGNAGAIDNLISKAKGGYQKRLSVGKAKRNQLEAVDFDEDFDRSSATDVGQLFAGDIGREKLISLLQDIQDRARQLKSLGMDLGEEIPFNFLFRGPPGTGKTTTAKKMGKVYYDMGFLSAAKVVECSASDLIGEFVGQTGPKVQQLLDKALGQVLFIDEAYRLGGGGGFAKEAVDELVDCVTKDKYKGKLIIILAGYVADINNLLSVNPGMTSRFPETIDFDPLAVEDCLKLLTSLLIKRKTELERRGKMFDLSCLGSPSESFKTQVLDLFRSLAEVAGWANARDVNHLAKSIFRRVNLSGETLRIEKHHVIEELGRMFTERSGREKAANKSSFHTQMASVQLRENTQPLVTLEPSISTNRQQNEEVVLTKSDEEEAMQPEQEEMLVPALGTRDEGVSDEVWEQLQRDRAEEHRREQDYRKLKEAQKSARTADRDRIVRQLMEEEQRRREEAARRAKLTQMGACPIGFQWIKQTGGYRCAGGSHYMSDVEVSRL